LHRKFPTQTKSPRTAQEEAPEIRLRGEEMLLIAFGFRRAQQRSQAARLLADLGQNCARTSP
jgi:hypothetical protein